ncbi:uncharacterized protein JCM15063_001304 [Sporobolomyces koalae]|uniref:uncharacterized protein n=1 Tax=Sporobolomyces koalae TaxID=500713 RepID=UPI003173C71D
MSSPRLQDAKVVQLASGKKLYVEVAESKAENAPAIVFIHGLGSSTTFWQATVTESKLQDHFTLIRYDFDGHGLSPFSREHANAADEGSSELSLLDLVEDLRQVLDWSNVKRAAGVVGHSMSGLVASTFAQRYPDRLDKLVLLGAMKALSPSNRQVMEKRSQAVLDGGLSPIVSEIVKSAISPASRQSSPLTAALVRALVLTTNPAAYSAACLAMVRAQDPDYSKIQAETLVVAGVDDYLSTPETTKVFADTITNVKVVEMQRVGHWHAVEAPEELRRILENFFL